MTSFSFSFQVLITQPVCMETQWPRPLITCSTISSKVSNNLNSRLYIKMFSISKLYLRKSKCFCQAISQIPIRETDNVLVSRWSPVQLSHKCPWFITIIIIIIFCFRARYNPWGGCRRDDDTAVDTSRYADHSIQFHKCKHTKTWLHHMHKYYNSMSSQTINNIKYWWHNNWMTKLFYFSSGRSEHFAQSVDQFVFVCWVWR